MKRNLLKKIACFGLVLVTLALGACKQQETVEPEREVVKAVFNGTHDYTAPESEEWLVRNGVCDYIIITPQTQSETIAKAVQEFIWLFKKATGLTLSTKNDNGQVHSETAKYISIGDTSLLKSTDIQVDKLTLGVDGGRIVTKDKTVYIVGGADSGTLYAVYTFMHITFGFEQYYKDCYEISTGETNVKLRNYAVTDIPDIGYRVSYSNYVLNDASSDYDEDNYGERLRLDTTMDEPMLPIYAEDGAKGKSRYYHNVFQYVPKETHGGEHPDWYANSGTQLCFTAHGNSEEREALAVKCAQKITDSMMRYTPDKFPLKNIVTFTIDDNSGGCDCAACLESKNKYGSDSAAMIQVTNRIGELVEEWQEKEENAAYRRENLQIICFAYNYTTKPPCLQNEQGEYYLVDDSVKTRDNVGVWVAPIRNIEYQASVYDEINDKGRSEIDAWGMITDNMYFWTYATNFYYYCYLYDSFDFFNSEGYTYLASTGAKYIFNQPQTGQNGTNTAWENLKTYLHAKLTWDCSLDTQELVNDYFNAMFKDAAPIMKELYYTMRSWTAHINQENGMYQVRSIYNEVEQKAYWPLKTLRGWLNRFDDAWAAIEKYKTTNPALYKELYYHIGAEFISPAYVTLKFYRNELSVDYNKTLTDKFKDVVLTTGMNTVAEHASGSMVEFVNKL